MKLVNEIGIWEAVTAFGEGDVPKAAGFRWLKDRKRWQATSALMALELSEYASEADQTRLRAEVDQIKAAEEAKVAASRATDADISIPAPEGLSYLPYQRAGIAYADGRTDTLIADEMGLGKTIQALGFVNLVHGRQHATAPFRVLVVAPKIALRNWQREAEKWLVQSLASAIWTAKAQPSADLVIVNYDVLGRPAVAEALRAANWDVAVFDEAHALKNDKAARTRSVFGSEEVAPLVARRRLFLTGTPVLNRPIELFPVLRSMGLPQASDFFKFARRYCAGQRTSFGFDASGASNLDELQTVLRKSVMVRRLKADVLTELPAKRFSVVELDADTPDLRRAVAAEQSAQVAAQKQETLLRSGVASARASGSKAALDAAIAGLRDGKRAAFTQMSRLRHETAVAKVPQVVEHTAGILEGTEESVLVFAHHADVIAGLREGLEAAGYPCAVITGDTSDQSRQQAQDDIQARRKRVFIGSMRACGVAITLTAASTVVFAEQDWTPGIMSQAEDRAHRIGQASSVLVQHLVVDGSMDATMAKTVAAKGGVITAALDDTVDEAFEQLPTAAEHTPEVAMVSIPEVTEVLEPTPVAQPDTEQPKRCRGRPPLHGTAMSKVERNRRWRERQSIVALEVPAAIAERVRKLREERGLSNAAIIAAALDALAQKPSTASHTGTRPDA